MIDKDEVNRLAGIYAYYSKLFPIGVDKASIYSDDKFKYNGNPAPYFNILARRAEGKYLVITNPECAHISNVLNEFDKLDLDKNYYVCACATGAAVNVSKYGPVIVQQGEWYQHTQHRLHGGFHFCSVLKKETYMRIGGFDEMYTAGLGYEDADFIDTIRMNGILLEPRDEIVVCHINHPRPYCPDWSEFVRKNNINKELYNRKWGK